MINKIDKDSYLSRLEEINNNDKNVNFKLEVSERKNHVSDTFIEMISEDGTNYLQGVAYAETYNTSKGLVIFIDNVYVDKNCKETNFGKVLVENLIKTVINSDSIKNINNYYAAMSITNSDEENYFIENGFYKTSNGRLNSSTGKTSMIRVTKELN